MLHSVSKVQGPGYTLYPKYRVQGTYNLSKSVSPVSILRDTVSYYTDVRSGVELKQISKRSENIVRT